MDDNNPHKKQEKFEFSSRKIVFGSVVVVLLFLVYSLMKDIQKLPPPRPIQHTSPINARVAPPISDNNEVAVAFQVNGRIAQMLFSEQAQVKQGDILATLDRAPFEQALASARAQLQMAQADYNKSLHIPTSNFNAIEAARANVETAQHVYDTAHAELQQRRSIMVAGQLDNVYTDDVQNERDAELDLGRARRELAQQEDAAGNNMDRDQYKAGMQAAQANISIAETALAGTQLVAPATGIIKERIGEVGADVTAGDPVYMLSVAKAAGQ